MENNFEIRPRTTMLWAGHEIVFNIDNAQSLSAQCDLNPLPSDKYLAQDTSNAYIGLDLTVWMCPLGLQT